MVVRDREGLRAPVKDSAGKVVMKQFTVTAAPTTTAPTTPAPSNLPPTGGAESILPALLAGATALHYLVRGRSLPPRLASHWDAVGRPDRWVSKRRAAVTD